ncbi:amino acid ABC transporter substrate-binding protein [Aminobacter sp. P9b]|uniref:General L-amino acid transport system substrate-binding protein n=1 Tax=Aminobacter niigataensis TaxID=83265 RepID=A0ABR6KXH4_9HYPH|nr:MULTISPECIES: amino acid ABC transporter substrate-binding protein [Aminobacter]AWC23164.1 General L-amino acid-binding periplasmic protein AapJ precursor [Aminobacter sp. MSH1]MBB4648540.1 general L-amino acid transport system substrate-binding protein [Aminobacter niigataensis]CAI2933806.1 General L-amino acid-binding periplasmic protein AapJ [Aminobacter niigataensis]
MKRHAFWGLVGLGILATPALAGEGDRVNAIKSRGELVCGTSTGTTIGLSTLDASGKWAGLEIDYCRAVAAAMFGDATKVKFAPLEFKNAFAALQSGSVDMLARAAAWTYSRDTEMKFDYAGVYMYDGQGFLVKKSLGVSKLAELGGASVCVSAGTTSELNLSDYFRSNGLEYTPIVANSREQNLANLEAGRCDAYTNERGGLAASRLGLGAPDDYVILEEIISKEPLGPIVQQDDPAFRDIASWTLFTLIAAEEKGITSANVAEMAASSENPEIQRMLGKTGDFGAKLGLANDWVVKVISSVGNYGEIFDRNLGNGSPVKLARGQNELWSNGGLLYAPPVR